MDWSRVQEIVFVNQIMVRVLVFVRKKITLELYSLFFPDSWRCESPQKGQLFEKSRVLRNTTKMWRLWQWAWREYNPIPLSGCSRAQQLIGILVWMTGRWGQIHPIFPFHTWSFDYGEKKRPRKGSGFKLFAAKRKQNGSICQAWHDPNPAPVSKRKLLEFPDPECYKEMVRLRKGNMTPEDLEFVPKLITSAPPKSRTPWWNIPSLVPTSGLLLARLESFSDDLLQWSPRNYDDIVSLLPWKVSNWHRERLMLTYLAQYHVYCVPSMSATLPRCILVSWAGSKKTPFSAMGFLPFWAKSRLSLQMVLFNGFSCDHNMYPNMFITCFYHLFSFNMFFKYIFIFQFSIIK